MSDEQVKRESVAKECVYHAELCDEWVSKRKWIGNGKYTPEEMLKLLGRYFVIELRLLWMAAGKP